MDWSKTTVVVGCARKYSRAVGELPRTLAKGKLKINFSLTIKNSSMNRYLYEKVSFVPVNNEIRKI